jgi:arginase
MKKIKFVEIKSEIGAGTRGASLGVDAIKIAALDYGSNLFNQIPSVEIPNQNKLLYEFTGISYAKRIKGILNIYENISAEISDTLKKKIFPIVLAGDHSTAGGTIAGIKNAFPKSKLGVIWIDAHTDINTQSTSKTHNLHGMPVGHLMGFENHPIATFENKILHPSQITYMGIREIDPPEQERIKRNHIRNYNSFYSMLAKINFFLIYKY